MSQQTSSPKQECKCERSKKMKMLEKQVSDLYAIVADLTKEIATLRKAVRK